jgi:hypothetical protein
MSKYDELIELAKNCQNKFEEARIQFEEIFIAGLAGFIGCGEGQINLVTDTSGGSDGINIECGFTIELELSPPPAKKSEYELTCLTFIGKVEAANEISFGVKFKDKTYPVNGDPVIYDLIYQEIKNLIKTTM